jgi:predicted dehydrogenase
MSKICWGILSTAKIGREHVIPAIQQGRFGEVTAIASRDLERARATAKELGIPTVYGSYLELLTDPNVDAIYNPLPNHLHVPWTIRALEAGKHVLCEKPIAVSVAEAEQLYAAATTHPESKVMEAFMVRFHPQWQTARQLVRNGQIGQLRTVQTFFSYFNVDATNIRNQRDMGGGAMLDIGCYAISTARYLFDGEPKRVLGHIERDPKTGIDRLASAVLEFFQGTASFTCSTQLVPYQRVNIFGTQGRIEIEIPFNAPSDRPCRVWIQLGQKAGTAVEELQLDIANQYVLQVDAFAQSILENAPVPTPLSDAVANMRVIGRVFASAESGNWA